MHGHTRDSTSLRVGGRLYFLARRNCFISPWLICMLLYGCARWFRQHDQQRCVRTRYGLVGHIVARLCKLHVFALASCDHHSSGKDGSCTAVKWTCTMHISSDRRMPTACCSTSKYYARDCKVELGEDAHVACDQLRCATSPAALVPRPHSSQHRSGSLRRPGPLSHISMRAGR